MSLMAFPSWVRSRLPFSLQEFQAFLIGILIALPLFFIYLRYFSLQSAPHQLEKMKKEEKELQKTIRETDLLLKELSDSIKKNQEILRKMQP